MGSQIRNYKIGADLDEAAAMLADQNGYPSRGAFLKGLIRYACLCNATHAVSLKWAKLDLKDQDRLENALKILVKAGQGMTAAEAANITFEEILARAEAVGTGSR